MAPHGAVAWGPYMPEKDSPSMGSKLVGVSNMHTTCLLKCPKENLCGFWQPAEYKSSFVPSSELDAHFRPEFWAVCHGVEQYQKVYVFLLGKNLCARRYRLY